MENQAVPAFGRTESIVIPFPGQLVDVSSANPPDAVTDEQRTGERQGNGQSRTYTFKQAAEILGCNESTLRRRYWQEKIEPAFKYCPTPLRSIVRYSRDERPVFEFSEFGLEVLKAFLAAKAKGADDQFLLEARKKYPEPEQVDVAVTSPETLLQTPTSAILLIQSLKDAGFEQVDGEFVDPDAVLTQLAEKNVQQSTALSVCHEKILNQSNQTAERLKRLQELLQQQRETERKKKAEKQAQWDSEVDAEVVDEFIYKKHRREELLSALENLNQLGKSPVAPADPPSG